MPIFEYAPDSGECDICDGKFEVFQKPHLRGLHLKHCPTCGKECHRVLSSFALTHGEEALLSDEKAGKKGFTKYRKVGDGQYEKVAGEAGPDHISRDMLGEDG